MKKNIAAVLFAMLLSVAGFASGADSAKVGAAANKSVKLSAARYNADHAALEVSFYLNHQYYRDWESEDELYDWEWQDIPIYYYKAISSDDPYEYDEWYDEETGRPYKVIKSEEKLKGRKILRTDKRRVPNPVSGQHKYRIECRAYALTENWAVMSATCFDTRFHEKSDEIRISGLNYDPTPINVELAGKINVAGKPATSYHEGKEVTLIYAAPGTPLSKVLAAAPKAYLRILRNPKEIFNVGTGEFIVNGKKRSLDKDSLNKQTFELDESGFFTLKAGSAADALFYLKDDKAIIAGFNSGSFAPVADIDRDIAFRWDECKRKSSSSYYTLSLETLNFIRSKTGSDWNNKVRPHILITVTK